MAQQQRKKKSWKICTCMAAVGACVVERSHSSLLLVVSCRSRPRYRDSNGRCCVPAGLKTSQYTAAGSATATQLNSSQNGCLFCGLWMKKQLRKRMRGIMSYCTTVTYIILSKWCSVYHNMKSDT